MPSDTINNSAAAVEIAANLITFDIIASTNIMSFKLVFSKASFSLTAVVFASLVEATVVRAQESVGAASPKIKQSHAASPAVTEERIVSHGVGFKTRSEKNK
jgi:hypothetical protein